MKTERVYKIILSSVDFDGSHTSVIRGGEETEYQGRKNVKQQTHCI